MISHGRDTVALFFCRPQYDKISVAAVIILYMGDEIDRLRRRFDAHKSLHKLSVTPHNFSADIGQTRLLANHAGSGSGQCLFTVYFTAGDTLSAVRRCARSNGGGDSLCVFRPP